MTRRAEKRQKTELQGEKRGPSRFLSRAQRKKMVKRKNQNMEGGGEARGTRRGKGKEEFGLTVLF